MESGAGERASKAGSLILNTLVVTAAPFSSKLNSSTGFRQSVAVMGAAFATPKITVCRPLKLSPAAAAIHPAFRRNFREG